MVTVLRSLDPAVPRRLTLILQLCHLLFTTGVWGRIKFVPETCQGKLTNTGPIMAELNNCMEHAPEDASTTCIALCVFHNHGILQEHGVSEEGVLAYIETTFPWLVWDRLKKKLLHCSELYREDDDDMSCSKSFPFVSCFEGSVDQICTVVAPPPPSPVQEVVVQTVVLPPPPPRIQHPIPVYVPYYGHAPPRPAPPPCLINALGFCVPQILG